ncbi:MAG TPA: DUF983 domain-containing protein [Kiloniellales bacterium]|nr:DUF983 domain-containing protein [Kiloniellales bacterium]
MPQPPEFHPRRSAFAVGLAGRCPRCGRGALYSGFLTVAERCAVCGLDLRKADSGDGPAVFIIFILGFLVVPLALLTEVWFTPPLWLHMALWPPLILGGALGLLRPMKGLLIALQFRHKASESGTIDYD